MSYTEKGHEKKKKRNDDFPSYYNLALSFECLLDFHEGSRELRKVVGYTEAGHSVPPRCSWPA